MHNMILKAFVLREIGLYILNKFLEKGLRIFGYRSIWQEFQKRVNFQGLS